MLVNSALGQFLWCFHPPIPRLSTPLVVVGQSDCRCVPISGRYGMYGTVLLLNNSNYNVLSLGSGTPIIIVVTSITSLFVCPSLTVPHAHTHSLV